MKSANPRIMHTGTADGEANKCEGFVCNSMHAARGQRVTERAKPEHRSIKTQQEQDVCNPIV
jgi:hypothetical protein